MIGGNPHNLHNLLPLQGLGECWPLNEASGTIYGIHGNNNSVSTLDITQNQAGKIDKGVLFKDPSTFTPYINFGDPVAIRGAQTFSMAGWVKFTDLTAPDVVQVVLSRYRNTGGSLNLTYRFGFASYKPQFAVWPTSGGAVVANGTTTVSSGTWYRIVGTHKAGGSIKVYLNGVLEGSAAAAASVKWNTGPSVYAGATQDSGVSAPDLFIDSTMEMLCFWHNVELTADQVLEDYNGRGAGIGATYPVYHTI